MCHGTGRARCKQLTADGGHAIKGRICEGEEEDEEEQNTQLVGEQEHRPLRVL